MTDILQIIMDEIRDTLDKVDEGQMERMTELLPKDKRVFVYGEGRSGFSARAFTSHWMPFASC